MPKYTNAADLIDAAADYIETHGWARKRAQNAQGGVCAIGALRMAQFGDANVEKADTAYWSAEDALSLEVRNLGFDGIAQFNDFGARDKRRVVRLMRRVARNLRPAA